MFVVASEGEARIAAGDKGSVIPPLPDLCEPLSARTPKISGHFGAQMMAQ